ncbi:MAG TPA: cyclodeaminase/cyclohydrolase family protein [Chloroflexota bacterium]
MTESRLVDQSVREFVGEVASAETPVPAGGSVVALSGSCAAALLALVCRVLQRHHVGGVIDDHLLEAERLQRDLLALVDEDADAYRAYLHARREPMNIVRVARTPLLIGQACARVIALSDALEQHDVRSMRGDVRAARHLAEAGVRTAIDLAEQNLDLLKDGESRRSVEFEISNLRSLLAR